MTITTINDETTISIFQFDLETRGMTKLEGNEEGEQRKNTPKIGADGGDDNLK